MGNYKKPHPETQLPKTNRVCDRLWWLMECNGDSNKRLGASTDIAHSRINMIVTGKAYPTIPQLLSIAKHYHVSTDFLLGLKDTID